MDHLDGIGVFAALTHPSDGIQRIVEKMRVDLRLQRLEFCLAQDNFLLADGGHKLLDAAYHVAEGVREVLHLPRAAHGLKGEVVGVLFKPRRDNRNAHHLPEALIDGFVNVADTDDAPCAARYTLYTVDDRVLHVGAVAEAGQTPGLLLL